MLLLSKYPHPSLTIQSSSPSLAKIKHKPNEPILFASTLRKTPTIPQKSHSHNPECLDKIPMTPTDSNSSLSILMEEIDALFDNIDLSSSSNVIGGKPTHTLTLSQSPNASTVTEGSSDNPLEYENSIQHTKLYIFTTSNEVFACMYIISLHSHTCYILILSANWCNRLKAQNHSRSSLLS